MSAEVAQNDDGRTDEPLDMDAYTFRELEAYMAEFYEEDAEFGIGGPFEADVDEVAYVSTDDEHLYAELQGAGFHIAFPNNVSDKTRFYVLGRDEEFRHSFHDRLEELAEAGGE